VKNLRLRIAGLALAVGVAGGFMAAPAFGAASPNDNGANCHGFFMSNLKDLGGGNPAQVAKAAGVSVKDVQDFFKGLCS
jgi:hypothetical protein